MNLRLRNHNPRPRRVLNSEFRLPSFPAQPPNRSRQVLPSQRLHILDLERLHVQLIHPQHRHGVDHVESEREGVHEVGALLQVADVGGVSSCLELNPARLEIHPDIDLHLLVDRSVDFEPRFLQRSVPVRRDVDFAELDLSVGDFVRLQRPEVRFLRELDRRLPRRSCCGFDVHGDGSGGGGGGGGGSAAFGRWILHYTDCVWVTMVKTLAQLSVEIARVLDSGGGDCERNK